MIQSSEGDKSDDVDELKFLVDLFHRCVKDDPTKRPTVEEIYKSLLAQADCIQDQVQGQDVRNS